MKSLSLFLLESELFEEEDESKILLSYEDNRTDVDYFYENISNVKYVVCQYIHDYNKICDHRLKSSYLFEKINESNVEKICIPNSYFTGYFPDLKYLKLSSGHNFYYHGLDYHFDQIISSYKNGYSIESCTLKIIDIDLYSSHELLENANTSLDNLINRESKTDIIISDYISENYKHVKLFYTFNHPTPILLLEVSNRILNYFGFNKLQYLNLKKFDVLYKFQSPIWPSVYKKLNLKFNPNTYLFAKDDWYSMHEIVKMYYNCYNETDVIV